MRLKRLRAWARGSVGNFRERNGFTVRVLLCFFYTTIVRSSRVLHLF